MKKIIVKSHKHIKQGEKSKDPLLVEIKDKINDFFLHTKEELFKELIELLTPATLQKAHPMKGQMRAGHKYIKRTGGPGNYKYWYKDPQTGRMFSSDAPVKPKTHRDTVPNKGPVKTLTVTEHSQNLHHKLDKLAAVVGLQEDIPENEIANNMKMAKPSTVKYVPKPMKDAPNLVKSTKFGAASEDIQHYLNQSLNDAETILAQLKLKFKTPINFYCNNLEGHPDADYQAMYHFETKKKSFEHHIALFKESEVVTNLMHEIGHAIDFSMSKDGEYMSDNVSNSNVESPTKYLLNKLDKAIEESPYYKGTSDKYKAYLKDKSELFARGFEVLTYKISQDLVKEGKIDQSFVDNFYPDLHKEGHRAILNYQDHPLYKKYSAKNEELNNQLKDLMIRRNKEGDSKAIQKEISRIQRNQRMNNREVSRLKTSFRMQRPEIDEKQKSEITDKISKIMMQLLSHEQIRKAIKEGNVIDVIT